MKRALAVATLLLAGLAPATQTVAVSDPRSVEIMQDVSARIDVGRQEARLRFVLTPKSGTEQVRESRVYRSNEEQARKLAIVFDSPSAIRGSGFLSWDSRAPEVADDQWLYLPALRRARRIPARDRGSYFLGTDLTYNDISTYGRIDTDEYRLGPPKPVAGEENRVEIEGEPVSPEIAKAIGYSKTRWLVDTERHFVLRSTDWDLQGVLLKDVVYDRIERFGAVWVAQRVRVENFKTGHRTELEFSDIVNGAGFDPVRLTPAGIERSD